jgi:hypothetical protein
MSAYTFVCIYDIIYVPVIEKAYNKERPKPHRLEYGAVPLDPWNATDPGDSLQYSRASLNRIDVKLAAAMNLAHRRGWVKSPELAESLQRFIGGSLYDSQIRRIELNPTIPIEDMTDRYDTKVESAKNGTATPSDLLELLVDYPDLGSLELAKLSHPLDFNATQAMDTDVNEALKAYAKGRFLGLPSRYKKKSYDPTIPAGTVLRKQDLFTLDTIHGTIQIVQRKSFVVRGDEEACADNDPFLYRKLKQPERSDELFQKIEAYLPDINLYPELRWLQPIATSYYAKYVD